MAAAWQDLKDHMKQAGSVEFAEVLGGGTGYVRFRQRSEAQAAMTSLQGSAMSDGGGASGCIALAEWTDPPPAGKRSSCGTGGGSDGAMADTSRTVCVTGIPPSATWQDLKDHMNQVGKVEFVEVLCGGAGFVRYRLGSEAQAARTALQGSKMAGLDDDGGGIGLAEWTGPPPATAAPIVRLAPAARGGYRRRRR